MAEPMGFFTDTTVCIGCKACEVACKQWNQLPSTNGGLNTLSGDSYDNTRRLDGIHWRHVKFIEQFSESRKDGRWLLMSDVCKHCVHAACLEVCPTGAIIRTEFDTVVIQSNACNGCRDCIGACPFGVIDINPVSNTAQKCTLCYDRLQGGLEPACSKACPTKSIQFGTIRELHTKAEARVEQLHQAGENRAYLYGADEKMLGGLNSFYLLVDKPEVYRLPPDPKMPSRNLVPGSLYALLGAIMVGLAGIFNFRNRGASEAWGSAAMNGAPSSTWFTTGPHWGWFIALYFFFGGLAGGSYFLAALIDLFGRREDRPLAHIGYYIAFPCVALSGLLLTVDLGKPMRFWHMLIESNTYRPMFKYWSPMSIGSWVLLTFGFFTLASFLGALAEDDRIPWPAFRKLRAPAAPGLVVELLGGISGFYVASYTGVLLGGDESSDLVRHASAGNAVRRIGGVDIGRIDDITGAPIRPDPARPGRPASHGDLGHRARVAGLHRRSRVAGAGAECLAEWLGPSAPDRGCSGNGRATVPFMAQKSDSRRKYVDHRHTCPDRRFPPSRCDRLFV